MLMLLFALALTSQPESASVLDDAEVSARLHFIEDHLAAQAPRAQAWFGVWTGVYGGLALGQGVLLLALHDHKSQVVYAAGGIGALVGTLSMTVIPMPAAFAGWRLRAVPESTPEERRRKLAVAERWLDHAADGELFEQSWLVQLGGVLVSAGIGLILELGYRFFDAAVENTFIGVAIAQTQVTTSPMQAVRDRIEYAQRFGLPAPNPVPPLLRLKFAVYPGGLAVAGSF